MAGVSRSVVSLVISSPDLLGGLHLAGLLVSTTLMEYVSTSNATSNILPVDKMLFDTGGDLCAWECEDGYPELL